MGRSSSVGGVSSSGVSGLVSVESSVSPGIGVSSSGLVGAIGSGETGAPSESGPGASYCSWFVEAFGLVLVGLSGDYWLASQFDGELEPSPAAWSEVGAAEKLAP